MGGGNRGLWVLLCVLIVVVLVLAAMLLPEWGSSGRSAAAAPAAVATVLGGAASRLLRPGRKKRTILGGRLEDFDQANIDLGADGLGYPDIQKDPSSNVQESHHQARILLKKAVDQYQLERSDPISGESAVGLAAPTSPKANVPATGWATTDYSVQYVATLFRIMCDIIRGDFSFIGSTYLYSSQTLPDYPWNNDFDLGNGNITRFGRWRMAHFDLLDGLDKRLIPALVDNNGSALPSRALFETARDYLQDTTNGLLDPNTPKLGPAPVTDPNWSSVDATSHPLDNGFSPKLIAGLAHCINLYTNPTDNLRNGDKFEVNWADSKVNDVIVRTNHILGLTSSSTKVTLARHHEMLKTLGDVEADLKLWANQIEFAAKDTGGGKTALYNDLVDAIGGSGSSATSGSLRKLLKDQYNRPDWQMPSALPAMASRLVAIKDSGDLHRDYHRDLRVKVRDLVLRFKALEAAYTACRANYELEWDTLDTLYLAIESGLVAAVSHYQTLQSWNNREQSVANLAALEGAYNAFAKALLADDTFTIANSAGTKSVSAPALVAALNDLHTSIDLVRQNPPTVSIGASTYTPAVGVPSEPAIINILMDVGKYKTSIVDVGKEVRRFLKTVFRKDKASTWFGIRAWYKYLRDGEGADTQKDPAVDPDSDVYVNVAIAAEAFARACFDFANKGDPAKIQVAEQAKKDLNIALTAFGVKVANSSLLSDNRLYVDAAKWKQEVKDAIQRTLVALAAVPELKFADQGNSASLQVARPLTESQRLIHYKSAPTESVIFASDPDIVVSAAGQKVVLEAKTPEDLEGMVARLPKHGPSLAYGLVVDRPGDMTALYKAVAIRLELRLPPEIERKVADRKNAATGWLYNIVQFESGAYYTSQHDYIKPELYAV